MRVRNFSDKLLFFGRTIISIVNWLATHTELQVRLRNITTSHSFLPHFFPLSTSTAASSLHLMTFIPPVSFPSRRFAVFPPPFRSIGVITPLFLRGLFLYPGPQFSPNYRQRRPALEMEILDGGSEHSSSGSAKGAWHICPHII